MAIAIHFLILICLYLPKNSPQVPAGPVEGRLYSNPVTQQQLSDTVQRCSQRQIALSLKVSYAMHWLLSRERFLNLHNHSEMLVRWSNLLEGFGVTNLIQIILISWKRTWSLLQHVKSEVTDLGNQSLILTPLLNNLF